jgi:serine/threonine-protein kinase
MPLPEPAGAEAVDPFLGKTLGGIYLVQQKIGSGGMGDVYKALHLTLEAPVALKIVRRGLLADPAMVHRLHREARAASRLRHPNVIAVRDLGEANDGMLFMVMEYVTGKSLARVIAEGSPMPERRVVHIGAQILAALAEAHANQILHRDLKPENVMIESQHGASDSVKVLDFGIAKILVAGQGASTLTQAGLVCGTPGYMSPEQLRGADLDGRSDIYSTGVVLYEMLTGRLPYKVLTPMEMLHKQLSEALVPPSVRRATPVSSRLEALVIRALSPRREDRPGSAKEMRDELLESAPFRRDPLLEVEAEQPLKAEILPGRDSPQRTANPRQTTQAPPRQTPAAALPGRPATRLPSGDAGGRATPRTTPARRTSSVSRPTTSRRSRAWPSGSQAQRDEPSGVGSASASRAAQVSSTVTPASGRSATAGSSSTIGATALDRAVLERIERRASPFLGPIAHHLLKKLSARSGTPADLCHKVATYISSGKDREAFLAASHAELNAPPSEGGTPAPRRATGVAWDPSLLERARRDLAVHVGSLARFLVQRACSRARDPDELYELLSLEIPSEADRAIFRRSGCGATRR